MVGAGLLLLLLPAWVVPEGTAPDLVISGILEAGDEVAQAGERVTVEHSVTNAGDSDADETDVGLYIARAQRPLRPFFLEDANIGDLEAGESDGESEQVALPASVPPGRYVIVLYVDYQDSVFESDERNNLHMIPIRIE